MTDIVERLRKLAKAKEWRTPTERELWNGLDEAADEIERLRAQKHDLLLTMAVVIERLERGMSQ